MLIEKGAGRRLFASINYAVLGAAALLCILPLVHVLAISFSGSAAVTAGDVLFWPVDFTMYAYKYVAEKPEFWRALVRTLERVLLGAPISILLTVMLAYPLSKESSTFRQRTAYVWIFVFTMLFGGGLIPTYLVVKETYLLDTVWALVVPSAVNVFNAVLMLNFFRGLPKALEEAALVDGAGHWRILWRIFVPLSAPSIATITLFTIVFHWNSWFDGLIYMNRPEHYPLQSYLQTVVVQSALDLIQSGTVQDLEMISRINDRTTKAAQIFLGALPILLVYPFLQKYFVKGITLGSVKE